MDDRIEEILRRLEALERRVDALSSEPDRASRAENESPCPLRSEERRIVDLIVELTAERVAGLLTEREHGGSGPEPGYPPHDGYGPDPHEPRHHRPLHPHAHGPYPPPPPPHGPPHGPGGRRR
jgi:hypothetical protein